MLGPLDFGPLRLSDMALQGSLSFFSSMSQVINDPIVGRLEKIDGDWEGQWSFALNNPVRVRVIVEVNSVTDKLPAKFQQFFTVVKTKDAEFRQAAAKKLLDLYNNDWRVAGDYNSSPREGKDYQPISEDEFANRLKLDTIAFVDDEDEVSVYYDDADMFAGHGIKVVASLDVRLGAPIFHNSWYA